MVLITCKSLVISCKTKRDTLKSPLIMKSTEDSAKPMELQEEQYYIVYPTVSLVVLNRFPRETDRHYIFLLFLARVYGSCPTIAQGYINPKFCS